jgi:DNA-binding response OmpR family regulator
MANQALLKSEAPDESGAAIQNAPAVLIADDDPAIRLILRHRLEAAGYNVSEAADSNAALAAFKTNRFDAALLDIIMPGVGGLEVLSAVQAEGIKTVIIVITAASTMSNAVEAIKRGAHDYLTNPFHNLDLVAAAVRAGGRDQPAQDRGRPSSGGRRDCRPQLLDAGDLQAHRTPGEQRRQRPDMRRERYRQGAGGARDPFQIRTLARPLRGGKLLGNSSRAAGKRIVRP